MLIYTGFFITISPWLRVSVIRYTVVLLCLSCQLKKAWGLYPKKPPRKRNTNIIMINLKNIYHAISIFYHGILIILTTFKCKFFYLEGLTQISFWYGHLNDNVNVYKICQLICCIWWAACIGTQECWKLFYCLRLIKWFNGNVVIFKNSDSRGKMSSGYDSFLKSKQLFKEKEKQW